MIKEILVIGMLLMISGCYVPDQVRIQQQQEAQAQQQAQLPVIPEIPPVEVIPEIEENITVENITVEPVINVTVVNVTKSRFATNTKYFVNNFNVTASKANLTISMFPSNTTYNTTCSSSYNETNCTTLMENRSMFLYLNFTKIRYNETKGNYSVVYDLMYDAKKNH